LRRKLQSIPWEALLLGGISALFLSRVLTEFAPRSTFLSTIAVIVSGMALIAVIAGHRRWADLGPLAVLVIYDLTPAMDGRLAAAVALAAVAGVVLLRGSRIGGVPSDPLIFIVALVGYVATLAPDVLPHDSGELQLVAPTLDIAHPPGYALYTMVGKVVSLIPLQTPAWRMNLFSAVLAACALVVVGRAGRELTGSAGAALVGVLALAGSVSFWATATTTNVRMLTALLCALIFWLLLRYGRTRSESTLVTCAFVFGLAVIHHGSLVFMAVPCAIFVLGTDVRILTRWKLLLRVGLAALASLLVLLYFPLRSLVGHAQFDPGGLTTLRGLSRHVLAQGFLDDVLYFSDPTSLRDRAEVLANILRIQFGWSLLAIAVIGLLPPLWLLPRVRPLLAWLLLAGSAALVAVVTMTYRAAQTVDYLTPVFIVLALMTASGAQRLASLIPLARLRPTILAACLLPSAVNMVQAAPSFVAFSANRQIHNVAAGMLQDAPPAATVLADWYWITPLRYMQTLEGLRPDVDLEYLVPSDVERYERSWRRGLMDAYGHGAVIVTNSYDSYAGLPFTLAPFHDAFIATHEPLGVPPDAARVGAQFGSELELVATQVAQAGVSAGRTLPVQVWWQPLNGEASRSYSVFLHLVGPDGKPLAQDDVSYSAAELRRGQTMTQESALTILPTVTPGDYTLIAGVYFADSDGHLERLRTASGDDRVTLGTVRITPGPEASISRHPLRGGFAGGPTLEGVDIDSSLSPRSRLFLHWHVPSEGGPWTVTFWNNGQTAIQQDIPSVPGGGRLISAMDVNNLAEAPSLSVHEAGREVPLERAWYWPASATRLALPPMKNDERFLNFGGEMALTGVSTNALGREVTVDLSWLSLQPLVRDYRVSVQLQGDGWQAQDDSAPALGAIPTTKWIGGNEVMDRHRIALPPGASGQAEVHVVVYDAFSRTRLAVLDDRFQAEGQRVTPRVAGVTIGAT
jgi:hypothetical protein